jgi:hypothetical protein
MHVITSESEGSRQNKRNLDSECNIPECCSVDGPTADTDVTE